MIKKFLKMICLVLSFMFILASCNDTGTSDSEGSSGSAENTLTLLNADGSTDYTIVRAARCSDNVMEVISNMYIALNKSLDTEIQIKIDAIDEVDEYGICRNNNKEILIGKTNRAESQEVLSSLGEDEYAMRIVNGKIVIVGSSDIATKKAIEEFCSKYIVRIEKGRSFEMALDSKYSGFYDGVVDLCKGSELRIMTLNVALDNYEPLKRRDHIINLVSKYDPDIFCLQECNAFMYSNLIYQLKNDYGVAFEKHENSDIYIYTPILYRKGRVSLIEGGGEWLDSRYLGTNTKSLSYGVFELNSTKEKFSVISLHGAVLGNSYTGYEDWTKAELDALATKWRADNVRQMLDVEKNLEKKYGSLPIMFAGDFNFAKNELPYQVITNAGLTEAELSATVSRMPGYKTTHAVGENPATDARYSIDHIFYYPESIKAYAHYVGVKTEDELWASDHLMVYADVEILG